jgi:methylmalonyl-CoA mutase
MSNSNKREKLFTEFSPISTDQWEAQIQADLKGADYEKKLVWRTLEDLKIRPYYRAEDLKDKEYLDTLPCEFPYTRSNKINTNDWEIRQDIKLDDIIIANNKSLFIIDRGITSLGFWTSPLKGDMVLQSQSDFTRLMKDIYFECIGLYFVCGNNAPAILTTLHKEVELKKIDPKQVIGAVDFDPLGFLTINGNYGIDEEADFNALKDLMIFADAKLPNYRVLGINGYYFNNAGASVVQELGYSLAMANDYLSRLSTQNISVDVVSRLMQFNFGVGPNYFMEIAKIRAARLLWAIIVEACKPSQKKSCRAFIHSVTSEWNQTIYDPYVNILRATTESMAAVLGGTDSLTVRPFDFSYKSTSKFSGRLARNIQIILKEEAYLNNVVDPGAGSYYIEILTDSIIDEAWKIFLKVEEEGGYLKALKKGIIQADIEATAQNRNTLIATRREILLGTNQYPVDNENVLMNVDETIAFPKAPVIKTSVKPIREYRGAMEFEKLRLSVEKHTKGRPKVFMLTFGDFAMRKTRAAFSGNFFACAGYEVIDNPGFKSVEEGVRSALSAKADIIVVCSSDEEYADLVPAVYELAKDKAIVVVAGAPACMEGLKQKGIENFIHMKSNVLETLIQYHKKLGIAL